MAVTIKNLASAQLSGTPASKGSLYTVPASTSTIVFSLSLVNTSGSEVSANVYYTKASGTARSIVPFNLLLQAGELYSNTNLKLTMGAGDKIECDVSVESVVDVVVSGVERT